MSKPLKGVLVYIYIYILYIYIFRTKLTSISAGQPSKTQNKAQTPIKTAGSFGFQDTGAGYLKHEQYLEDGLPGGCKLLLSPLSGSGWIGPLPNGWPFYGL